MSSAALAFLAASSFATSPLSHLANTDLPNTEAARISRLLLAYYRLLVADLSLSKRLTWQHQQLLSLATSHPDSGVRLLAVQVLAVQMGWSESYRIEREREYVGDVGLVDAPVVYGEELVLEDGQAVLRQVVVDGWLLPMYEARRAERREYLLHPS